MKIQLSEIETDKPFFGKERIKPDVLAAIIEGKEEVIEINVERKDGRNYHRKRVDLCSQKLSDDEKWYLCRVLFFENHRLEKDQQLQFEYQVLPSEERRLYVSVPKDEREVLEKKLRESHNWALACQFHKKGLEALGLKIEYSDEDVATLPFIIIAGTSDSKGTVAYHSPISEDHHFLGGTINIVNSK